MKFVIVYANKMSSLLSILKVTYSSGVCSALEELYFAKTKTKPEKEKNKKEKKQKRKKQKQKKNLVFFFFFLWFQRYRKFVAALTLIYPTPWISFLLEREVIHFLTSIS